MKQPKHRVFRLFCAAVTALTSLAVPTGLCADAATLLSAEFETTNDSFTGRVAEQWQARQSQLRCKAAVH